ncbi:hypothetical protein MRB53_008755 [Persea americana]|uniref:Uncharacterized protein n=1 Tax=Persea americana TaxID=3435 RepID=A0ACC2LMQ6_PERAE|nr:hypothetical protein MRB53_008755 [Persea americana]
MGSAVFLFQTCLSEEKLWSSSHTSDLSVLPWSCAQIVRETQLQGLGFSLILYAWKILHWFCSRDLSTPSGERHLGASVFWRKIVSLFPFLNSRIQKIKITRQERRNCGVLPQPSLLASSELLPCAFQIASGFF